MGQKLPIRVIALDDWPATDRHAWSRARTKGNILDEQHGRSIITDSQLPRSLLAYGSWLGFLADYKGLQFMESGLNYLNKEYMREFLHLLETHVAPCTSRNYMTGLLTVARGMNPDAHFSDLSAAARRIRRHARPARDKRSRIVPSRVLWDLGLDLMQTCDECTTRPKVMGQYRDGLMIALLASRPIRCKNLAQIEIGVHLRWIGDVYWLFFDAQDMKNRRSFEFPLPPHLTHPIQHYLDDMRPELAEQHGRWKTDVGRMLWVGEGGSTMKRGRISVRIRQRTEARFGHPVTPHLFRDAAATSIAESDPKHVGMIRAVLGHSSLSTSEIHYNHAGSLEAARRLQHAVADLRGSSKG